ncbi:hypothetical protein ANO11243_071460 [Dothideomycetidae sp. 11243]|nr:hypothetical protein ANO11243_071460 [fungal sp. No.11243]
MVGSHLIAFGALLLGAVTAADPVVTTSYGKLLGTTSPYRPNIDVFKGIPFARPPVGELRWRAPEKPRRWHGLRNATEFGAECPQFQSNSRPGFNSPLAPAPNVSIAEDCLYLNVWTPSSSGSRLEDRNLPVYLWYYGGRFTGGSGAVPAYDGSGLASKDVVVVTVNYRTGPFGFLAHPELLAEDPNNSTGNYAVLDMQAALRWVKDEIRAFGGNPDHITTGGQSSGSSCSLDMMFSPLSQGLIAGAIAESGARAPHDPLTLSLATSYRNMSAALANGVKTAEAFNVSTIAEMRNLSMATLLTVLNENGDDFVGTQLQNVSNFMAPPEWRPVLDGYVLEYLDSEYGQALKFNHHAQVPILTGNNKDESGSGGGPNRGSGPSDPVAAYQAQAELLFGPQNLTARYLAEYPGSSAAEAANSSARFGRDLSRVSTWQWAREWAAGGARAPVWTYYWTHAPPVPGNQGAFHGSELYYVFNNVPYANPTANWTATDFAIQDVMGEYWANYIKTGNPNGGNLTTWEPSCADQSTMTLGDGYGAIPLTEDEASFDLIEDWFSLLHEY